MKTKTNLFKTNFSIYYSSIRMGLFLCCAILFLVPFNACRKEEKLSGTDVLSLSNKNKTKTAAIPTKNEALVSMQVYNNQFFNNYGSYGSSFKAYYWKDKGKTGRMDFWTQAEAIETLLDAYDINPNTDFKNKIQYLYNGMRDGYGTLWTNNIYNDDLIWGAIMCIRSYAIWNDGGMKDMAKNNFDLVWSRGWDNSLGGGLWWTTAKTSKNTCVNAPAAICAMYLYEATGDVSYRNKAKLIMDWMVTKFYNSNGEVKGAMNAAGVITEGALSYTQGTFIGACHKLKNAYPSVPYVTMGSKVLDYTRSNMCNVAGGYLVDEDGIADTQGMKSIFARWACMFVNGSGTKSNYAPWLNYNAERAWIVRNNNALIWNKWGVRTSDTANLNAFQTTCGPSMINNVWRIL